MYNEETKIKFIQDYTNSESSGRFAVTVFNAFAPHEEAWGADLCTKTAEELQPAVDSVLCLRTRGQWSYLLLLRTYCKWCIAHKIPGACDGAANINTVGVDKIRKQMVSGPMHLQKYLDDVFPPVEDESISILYRCYLWMAFGGVPEEDVTRIKCSDVDLDNMVIRFCGKSYDLYREAVPAFRLAATLTSFNYYHDNPVYVSRRDRYPGDTLMRGIKTLVTTEFLYRTLWSHQKKAIAEGKTEQNLSYRRVMLSGLFYRNYEMERIGLPLNFTDVVIEETKGKTYSLNRRMKVEHIQNRIMRGYLEDYQRWKFVFAT